MSRHIEFQTTTPDAGHNDFVSVVTWLFEATQKALSPDTAGETRFYVGKNVARSWALTFRRPSRLPEVFRVGIDFGYGPDPGRFQVYRQMWLVRRVPREEEDLVATLLDLQGIWFHPRSSSEKKVTYTVDPINTTYTIHTLQEVEVETAKWYKRFDAEKQRRKTATEEEEGETLTGEETVIEGEEEVTIGEEEEAETPTGEEEVTIGEEEEPPTLPPEAVERIVLSGAKTFLFDEELRDLILRAASMLRGAMTSVWHSPLSYGTPYKIVYSRPMLLAATPMYVDGPEKREILDPDPVFYGPDVEYLTTSFVPSRPYSISLLGFMPWIIEATQTAISPKAVGKSEFFIGELVADAFHIKMRATIHGGNYVYRLHLTFGSHTRLGVLGGYYLEWSFAISMEDEGDDHFPRDIDMVFGPQNVAYNLGEGELGDRGNILDDLERIWRAVMLHHHRLVDLVSEGGAIHKTTDIRPKKIPGGYNPFNAFHKSFRSRTPVRKDLPLTVMDTVTYEKVTLPYDIENPYHVLKWLLETTNKALSSSALNETEFSFYGNNWFTWRITAKMVKDSVPGRTFDASRVILRFGTLMGPVDPHVLTSLSVKWFIVEEQEGQGPIKQATDRLPSMYFSPHVEKPADYKLLADLVEALGNTPYNSRLVSPDTNIHQEPYVGIIPYVPPTSGKRKHVSEGQLLEAALAH